MSKLAQDDHGNFIQALKLKDGSGAHTISSDTATAAKNATAFETVSSPKDAPSERIVSVYATTDIYIRFGTSTVVAANTDHFFPAGIYYDFAVSTEHTHCSVLAVSSNGIVYLSEKE